MHISTVDDQRPANGLSAQEVRGRSPEGGFSAKFALLYWCSTLDEHDSGAEREPKAKPCQRSSRSSRKSVNLTISIALLPLHSYLAYSSLPGVTHSDLPITPPHTDPCSSHSPVFPATMHVARTTTSSTAASIGRGAALARPAAAVAARRQRRRLSPVAALDPSQVTAVTQQAVAYGASTNKMRRSLTVQLACLVRSREALASSPPRAACRSRHLSFAFPSPCLPCLPQSRCWAARPPSPASTPTPRPRAGRRCSRRCLGRRGRLGWVLPCPCLLTPALPACCCCTAAGSLTAACMRRRHAPRKGQHVKGSRVCAPPFPLGPQPRPRLFTLTPEPLLGLASTAAAPRPDLCTPPPPPPQPSTCRAPPLLVTRGREGAAAQLPLRRLLPPTAHNLCSPPPPPCPPCAGRGDGAGAWVCGLCRMRGRRAGGRCHADHHDPARAGGCWCGRGGWWWWWRLS